VSAVLSGDGLRLRAPEAADYQSWAALREISRAHTERWQPSWSVDELTRPAYERRLDSYQADIEARTGYPFFIFQDSDDALVGACILSDVRRGVLQAANLGYWVGAPYVRKGYGSAAVRLVVRFAFETLGLNRVEAATRPENEASSRLLRSAGFTHEGEARRYLKIDGDWRDHLKFAILHDDPLR